MDDVFAQSVEPLLPLHDEIELCDAAPIVNGQTTLSNESLASSSASKIIKVFNRYFLYTCLDCVKNFNVQLGTVLPSMISNLFPNVLLRRRHMF